MYAGQQGFYFVSQFRWSTNILWMFPKYDLYWHQAEIQLLRNWSISEWNIERDYFQCGWCPKRSARWVSYAPIWVWRKIIQVQYECANKCRSFQIYFREHDLPSLLSSSGRTHQMKFNSLSAEWWKKFLCIFGGCVFVKCVVTGSFIDT